MALTMASIKSVGQVTAAKWSTNILVLATQMEASVHCECLRRMGNAY
jgi:hypothetical protein